MGYNSVALENKLLEMHPEITEHGISVSLRFDKEQNAWLVHLAKENHKLDTFIDKNDADECMDGVKCVRLGVKLGEFLDTFNET